ncbi:MAG: hypothetical protein EAZ13_08270 [Sphingobacteriia bacterium]|nr:MAG: hypothetical protein EAZ35_07890 [Sphingobacteriia bacterium]TAH06739.1 MAG: hypothetical protein EAZ13_08270 [Sphingobacteriia bacterium]
MCKKTVLAIFSVIIFCSWSLLQKNEIEKAEWLIGTWENKTQHGSIYETWSKVSDVELSGKSYMLKEKDTIVFETIRLIQEQKSLFYIPNVKNQNDNMPVRFIAKTVSDKELVFENPNHDFPQIISYSKINANDLVAEIAGTKNGKERKQIFPMSRIK